MPKSYDSDEDLPKRLEKLGKNWADEMLRKDKEREKELDKKQVNYLRDIIDNPTENSKRSSREYLDLTAHKDQSVVKAIEAKIKKEAVTHDRFKFNLFKGKALHDITIITHDIPAEKEAVLSYK